MRRSGPAPLAFVVVSVVVGCHPRFASKRDEAQYYYGRRQYARALTADPSHNDARFMLARDLMTDQDYVPAEAHWRTCISYEPENGYLWSWLAHALKGQGRYEEAIEAYTEAAKRPLPEEDADWFRSHTLVEMADCYDEWDKRDKALETYREAIELDPDRLDDLAERAGSLYYFGHHQEAREKVKLLQELGGTPDPELMEKLKRERDEKDP